MRGSPITSMKTLFAFLVLSCAFVYAQHTEVTVEDAQTITGNKTFKVTNTATVYIQAGETVAQAVARLPVGGGVVQLSNGVYQSGNVSISTPNITIQGVGAPTYNSQTNPTALNTDGTVVQGPIQAQQGADGFTVRNLGVDCGSAWFVANGSILPGACLGIFNVGQVNGAPPVQNPVFDNITCLGNSVSAAAHCIIQENVHKGIIENSRTFFMTHGMVQKGYDNYMSNVTAQGHASDCFIFKSDVYAPGGRWKLKNFSCNYGTVLGDSQGIVVQANNGGNVQYVEISNGEVTGQTGRGIILWGNDNADQLLQVLISNVNFDSQNASAYCLVNQGYVSDVTMTGFHCLNSSSGGIANLSIGTQNDFNYSNGIIANITGNGIDTIGRTHVSGVDFVNITGNAIQTENSGITYECNNSFAAIGGSTLAAVGSGSYRWCNNSSTEDLSGDISFPAGLGPGKSAIAAFPACTSSLEGQHLIATTCNAGCSAGGTCTTGGTTHCEMYCNSSPAWVETGR